MSSPLISMEPREFIGEVKSRLRDAEAWGELLEPALVNRTRWALSRIITSIDTQKSRVGDSDPAWTKRVDTLRRYASERLSQIPAPLESNNKEIMAWKALSARLAGVLAENDPVALESITTPYGGLTVAEWLTKRQEKGA